MQGSKVHFGVGNNLQSLPKYPYRNKRTMGNKIGVLVAQGLDVPKKFYDVPNFVNNVTNFIKDVPNFVKNWAKIRSEVGIDFQSLLEGVQRNKWSMERKKGILLAQGLDVSNFLKDVPRVPKSVSE